MIKEVYIGSLNPAKINAVKIVFPAGTKIVPEEVPTSVSAQPFSDEETRQGAIHRAVYLTEQRNAAYGIGLEGGVVEVNEGLLLCNWGALAEKGGKVFTAGGARILLPVDIADQVRQGQELGEVIDKWSQRKNVRKKEGTVGILTAGEITREMMFEHVVRLIYGQWKFSTMRE